MGTIDPLSGDAGRVPGPNGPTAHPHAHPHPHRRRLDRPESGGLVGLLGDDRADSRQRARDRARHDALGDLSLLDLSQLARHIRRLAELAAAEHEAMLLAREARASEGERGVVLGGRLGAILRQRAERSLDELFNPEARDTSGAEGAQ